MRRSHDLCISCLTCITHDFHESSSLTITELKSSILANCIDIVMLSTYLPEHNYSEYSKAQLGNKIYIVLC